MIIVDDNRSTGRKYHESSQIISLVAGRRAVAPAGGCVVSVICIRTIAVAVDKDAASQRRESNLAWSGMRLNSFVIHIPVRPLMK